MLPDLESLRCFVAAAERLNFRMASHVVALSPAAFGDRIKRLEQQLGVTLFERTTRKVRLTTAAERLLPEARRCLAQAERCVASARSDAKPVAYELTIGTRFELGMSWLMPAIASFEKLRPERRFNVSFGDTEQLLSRLRRDDIDAFISSARLTEGGLDYARLHEESYAFVAAASLVDGGSFERPEDVAPYTLLELRRDRPLFRYFLDARPGHEEWSFSRTQTLGTIGAVRVRALQGAGLAVLPRYFVEPDLQEGRLRLLFPEVVMATDWFRLIWRRGSTRQSLLRELATELENRPLM